MKTMQHSEPQAVSEGELLPEALVDELMADDILPEYRFDYSKARPNRFAARLNLTRLAEECAKLDVREEQAAADEGLAADAAEWSSC